MRVDEPSKAFHNRRVANSTSEQIFQRTALLLGPSAMEELSSSRVLIAGLGAVGSAAAEGLARSGLGRFTLIDFDDYHPSNINRQLPALHSTLGQPKTEMVRQRLLDINPAAQVEVINKFLRRDRIRELTDATDAHLIIDAIDTLHAKVDLMEQAVLHEIPIISSLGAALRLDPTQVRIDDLAHTRHCPLGRFIRKRLRKRGIHRGIRCVYSTEFRRPQQAARAWQAEESDSDRSPLGSFCPVTVTFGMAAAAEAVRLLLGGEGFEKQAGNPSRGKRGLPD